MLFRDDTLQNFQKITGFDIVTFLDDFVTFSFEQRQNIVDFYSGSSKTPDADSFVELARLLKEAGNALNLFSLSKEVFCNFADWNLVEQVEEINCKLQTLDNSSRWLRSAITKNNFSGNSKVDITLKQNQTIEKLSEAVLSSTNPQNQWSDIALENKLKEEDYTPEGGVLLSVSFQNEGSFQINSVVDNISGKKVYGIDIQKRLEFEDDDLKVLSAEDTILQAVNILSNLRTNDNPEFPENGVSAALIVGNTLGALSYPNLFRQLFSTFAKDDTLKSFDIVNVSQENDSVDIEFRVTSRLDEVINQTISINP